MALKKSRNGLFSAGVNAARDATAVDTVAARRVTRRWIRMKVHVALSGIL